jgi:hypothetical protein
VLAILFILTSGLLGVRLTYLLPMAFRLEERVVMGIPVGLALTTLAGFLTAWVAGMSVWVVAGVGTVAGVIGVLGLLSGSRPTALRTEWRDLRKRSRTKRFWLASAVFALFALLLGIIFAHALTADGDTIYAGFANVWGDWNQHLAQTTSFLNGDNFPPTLTTMSGQKLTYPFATNFLSALLAQGGLPLLLAMKLPAGLLAISGLGMLMVFTRRVAGSAAAIISPFLFYLLGGLGFVNAFDDFGHSGKNLIEFLAHQPHNYTQTFGDVILPNINFINPIYAYVVPQRAFIFGLPLVLTVLVILHQALKLRKNVLFLAAGLVAALLPLVHTHGLIFLGLIFPALVLFTRNQLLPPRRRILRFRDFLPWLYFLAPIALLALPEFLWLTSGVDTAKFLRPQPGWLAREDNVLWFWLKNLGPFIPILLAVFVGFRKRPRPDWYPFALAAASVFLLANLFIFQPWDWDNTKFFVYWVIASIPAVAAGLVWLYHQRWYGKAVAGVCLVTLCLSGTIEVSKVLSFENAKVGMFDGRGQEIAATIRAQTNPKAVFLTAQQANNPIAGLSGRPIVLGYTGWLWSYGIEYESREDDVVRIYQGSPETPTLLDRYAVDYVLIGPAERNDKGYQVNESYFASRYPVWQRFGDVTIYDVRGRSTVSPT